MDTALLRAARAAIGFMPEDEGLALFEAGLGCAAGPWLEIGSYCGKSAIYLGAAAREKNTVLYSLDHHRGSEEHQPGEEYFDERLVDASGRIDSLPIFRATIEGAGLTDVVVPVVGLSEVIAQHWSTPLGLVFIDGGHSAAACTADYRGWAPHVVHGGLLIIHDVYLDASAGGQGPRHIYERALASSAFKETSATRTLRVLERIDEGL